MIDPSLIAARRALRIDGYATLAEVGMDGDYVSPLQISARSATGPVLLAYHWSDVETLKLNREKIQPLGYFPGIPFNRVVDRALEKTGLTRGDVYMTQVFHLLPLKGRSSAVPAKHLDASFDAVTRHELKGRKVIALGTAAKAACLRHGITPLAAVDHPSARGPGRTVEGKAEQLAAALRLAMV